MTKKSESSVIILEDFNVNQLPELQGKKEEIKAIIDANPIIEIVDTKTYEEAKKSRTAVKSLRTSLEKEKKNVLDRIKEKIVNTVASAYDTEILDVKAEEELRQTPVTEWETAKAKEAEAKRLAEEKRVADIKESIANISTLWKQRFEKLTFDKIDFVKKDFEEVIEQTNRTVFAEFALLFDKEVSLLLEILNAKVKSLTEAENNRLERERLEEEKKEQSRVAAIKSGVSLWHSAWITRITNLTFENSKSVSDEFEKETPLHCQEFQADYGTKRVELQKMLSDRIEFLKFAEKQRIDQINFYREKAEFETKQLKARTESRVKQLTDLGIGDEVIENGMGGNSRWATLKNSAETEEDAIWNETLLWVKTMIESRDKPSPSALKGIEVEEEAVTEPKFSEVLKHVGEVLADVYSTSETEDVIMEVDFEETWESIFEKYLSETSIIDRSFIEWLRENYEVPNRKKE